MEFFEKAFLAFLASLIPKIMTRILRIAGIPASRNIIRKLPGKELKKKNAIKGPAIAPLLSIAFCSPKLLPL